MPTSSSKPLMRSLGEFFGHIVKAVRSDPSGKVVRKQTEQEDRGDVVLRRTTIEEIEFRDDDKGPSEKG